MRDLKEWLILCLASSGLAAGPALAQEARPSAPRPSSRRPARGARAGACTPGRRLRQATARFRRRPGALEGGPAGRQRHSLVEGGGSQAPVAGPAGAVQRAARAAREAGSAGEGGPGAEGRRRGHRRQGPESRDHDPALARRPDARLLLPSARLLLGASCRVIPAAPTRRCRTRPASACRSAWTRRRSSCEASSGSNKELAAALATLEAELPPGVPVTGPSGIPPSHRSRPDPVPADAARRGHVAHETDRPVRAGRNRAAPRGGPGVHPPPRRRGRVPR